MVRQRKPSRLHADIWLSSTDRATCAGRVLRSANLRSHLSGTLLTQANYTADGLWPRARVVYARKRQERGNDKSMEEVLAFPTQYK